MTKDDIMKWAHKSGFLIDTHAQQYQPNCILSTYGLIDENLERFANLVAAHKAEVALAERDVLLRQIRHWALTNLDTDLVAYIDAIRARTTT